jgi:polyisoprenyl-teichoic acid--peptidoglycan teichoic acid transferase
VVLRKSQPDSKVGTNVSSYPAQKTSGIASILGLSAIGIVSAIAGGMLAFSMGTTPFLQSKLSPTESAVFNKLGDISSSSFRFPSLTRPVNILVVGTKVLTTDLSTPPEELKDLKYHALVNSFDGLTDTMMLIRFDPDTGKLTVMSIPRDTRTYIEGHGVTKINEANVIGGPALTAITVSELMGGVHIDRYVRINVQGVEALIDTLGGLTVEVPQDMKYQDDSQHLYINLKAGKQHLNGNQVLQVLRFRHDGLGDIGRIKRQQVVMKAFSEQVLNPLTLARLPQILSVIQSHVDANLNLEEIFALTGFAVGVDRAQQQFTTLPGEFSTPGQYNASYWLPHREEIRQLAETDFGLNATH